MKKRRAIGLSLLIALSSFGLWRFWWSALDHNPQQDQCTFGTVSNARYLELLAEAKRRQRLGQQAWIPLRGSAEQRADLIRYRIEDLTTGMTSLYERMAAAHAVMRAAGGHITHDGSTGNERHFWQFRMERSGPVPDIGSTAFSFDYALYSWRPGEASLFHPRSWVVVALRADSKEDRTGYKQLRWSQEDEFYTQILDPNFPLATIGWYAEPPLSTITQQGLGCPVLPPPIFADAFDQWSAARRAQRSKP